MIQIDDVVVSLDVFREKFLCDLGACKGECCIEGDAGAPVEMDEVAKLEEVLPVVWEDLAPEAQAIIDKQGVVYTDEEGDLVTSIVNGKAGVFTCYDEKGSCFCAIEKAYRAGKVDFCKPVSCALYPIRVGDYGPYKAVNYHRWSVCKAAVLLGRKENLPVYKFLKEPLIRKFGEAWYAELEIAAEELKNRGFNLVSGGTDNHLMLVDLENKNITGIEAEKLLDEVGITVNKNAVPYDKQKPNVAGGIRIGTPAVTTRGMKEEEMKEIASLIDRTINCRGEHCSSEKEKIKLDVLNLTNRFPIY
jgi:hypothetical protein